MASESSPEHPNPERASSERASSEGAGHERSGSGHRGSGHSHEAPAEDGFRLEAAQRVLRRAVELGEERGATGDPDRYAEAALVEAAEEVGLEGRVVQYAAAEERLGLLDGDVGTLDRVAGPSTVTVTAVAPGAPRQVAERVDAWLRRRGGMRRVRLHPDGTGGDYERRTDVVAGLQRSLRSVTGREHLGSLPALSITVTALDSSSSMVAVRCDLSTQRAATVAGGAVVALGGSTASVVVALADLVPVLPWVGVPVSIAAGWGVLRARVGQVQRSALTLEGIAQKASGASLRP